MTILELAADASPEEGSEGEGRSVRTSTRAILLDTATDQQAATGSRPPVITRLPRSELLDRVASFLPKLASSNRQLAAQTPEAANIEHLTGREDRVIELRLGLGVLESQEPVAGEPTVAVLPSELEARAAAVTRPDPLETVIHQLLSFDGDAVSGCSDGESSDTDVSVDTSLLDFE